MSPEENVIELDDTKKKRRIKKKRTGYKFKSLDFWMLVMVMGLVIFGVVMVFSASFYNAISKNGTPFYYLIRDIIFAVLGTVVMLFMSAFDYHKLKKFTFPVLAVSVVLLILLLVPSLPFVVSYNGSARWIGLGFFNLMPGEIAKPAMILFTAAWLGSSYKRVTDIKNGVIPVFLVMVVVCGLIAVNNAITSATVAAIMLGMLFVAGLSLWYFGGLMGLGILGFAALILTDSKGYRLARVTSFLHPFDDPQGAGYQVIQGLLALGSGGLTGLGLGKSMQKTLYLPEPQNDFIYAVIGEELGYVGLLVLLMVYLGLIYRCVKVALKAPDLFGCLLAAGITIMLALQVILNIMVVTSLMPPTGVALPFISWGGNALLVFMGSMGVMLNISRQVEK